MHHNTPTTLKPGRYAVYNSNTYTSQVWNVTAERVDIYTAPSGVYPSAFLYTASHAEALDILGAMLSRVLAFRPAPRTIGNAAAHELHKELGRLKYRNHYRTASEALDRPVSSLASLTADEAGVVSIYARVMAGVPA